MQFSRNRFPKMSVEFFCIFLEIEFIFASLIRLDLFSI
ncbi:hypothetical protein LEP1GSC036_4283 [Leptospira weilii str. 2006001853]|uniref:Uncharacterized protein n=1 Tax=Leptospira weilii str. 2006001853 TaxID=1001589 RepID=A0A828Z089_9LEPT|nr:hypothetical protein LEP1GSC036_4283 [Leptospira weilii str. 2006001853]